MAQEPYHGNNIPLRNMSNNPPAFHKPFTTKFYPYIELQELPPVFDYNGSRVLSQNKIRPSHPTEDVFLPPIPASKQQHPYPSVQSFDPPPQHPQTWYQTYQDPRYHSQFSQTSGNQAKRYVVRARELITKYMIEWWLVEIISWTFSAICMAAIIGVLFYYDGKELPQWKFGVTLNGFISVFSGFAKAALLLPTAEGLGQHKWSMVTPVRLNIKLLTMYRLVSARVSFNDGF
jgi:hypothetical protein